MPTRRQIPNQMLERTFDMLAEWPESDHIEHLHVSDRVIFSGTIALQGVEVLSIVAERDRGRQHVSEFDHRLILGKEDQGGDVAIEVFDLIRDYDLWVAGADHYTVGQVKSDLIPSDTKILIPNHGVERPVLVNNVPQINMTQLMWEHVLS